MRSSFHAREEQKREYKTLVLKFKKLPMKTGIISRTEVGTDISTVYEK